MQAVSEGAVQAKPLIAFLICWSWGQGAGRRLLSAAAIALDFVQKRIKRNGKNWYEYPAAIVTHKKRRRETPF